MTDDTRPLPPPATARERWTLASRHQDFVDWRRGRTRYALWAIDAPGQLTAVACMRRHLADYLLPGDQRQPHITLRVCGFPGAAPGLGDDFTPDALQAQIKALESARLSPFTIEIGAPETFTSSPFLSVLDPAGSIARVRRALGGEGISSEGLGEQDFVPHLTVGLYRGRFSLTGVRQRMRSCPGLKNAPLAVRALTLMTYEAAVISGPLSTVAEFDLERQAWRVVDAAAMNAMNTG
jgi:2'-5' RNA ligase